MAGDSRECALPPLWEGSSEFCSQQRLGDRSVLYPGGSESPTDMWATQLRKTNSKCKKELRLLESPIILYPAQQEMARSTIARGEPRAIGTLLGAELDSSGKHLIGKHNVLSNCTDPTVWHLCTFNSLLFP